MFLIYLWHDNILVAAPGQDVASPLVLLQAFFAHRQNPLVLLHRAVFFLIGYIARISAR